MLWRSRVWGQQVLSVGFPFVLNVIMKLHRWYFASVSSPVQYGLWQLTKNDLILIGFWVNWCEKLTVFSQIGSCCYILFRFYEVKKRTVAYSFLLLWYGSLVWLLLSVIVCLSFGKYLETDKYLIFRKKWWTGITSFSFTYLMSEKRRLPYELNHKIGYLIYSQQKPENSFVGAHHAIAVRMWYFCPQIVRMSCKNLLNFLNPLEQNRYLQQLCFTCSNNIYSAIVDQDYPACISLPLSHETDIM